MKTLLLTLVLAGITTACGSDDNNQQAAGAATATEPGPSQSVTQPLEFSLDHAVYKCAGYKWTNRAQNIYGSCLVLLQCSRTTGDTPRDIICAANVEVTSGSIAY